jgi:hypothetical protein
VSHNPLRQKEKANLISQTGLYLCRQRPTLPHTFACSTIGPAGLNFRVRDGNGWNPRGKITDKSEQRLLVFGLWSIVVSQRARWRVAHFSGTMIARFALNR